MIEKNQAKGRLYRLLRSLTKLPVLLLAAGLTMSSVVSAEEAKTVKADAVKVDPAKGEALYSTGDSSRNIPACLACHGAAGNSTIAQNPRLAAQHEAYLRKQLENFTSPSRNNPVMTPIAKALSADDIKNLAAYLSAQNPKPNAAKNKDTLELGKKIYRAGIAEKNIPACAGCHSPNGAGVPAQFPRLAGQHQDYTAAQLTNFRMGTRTNSPQMTAIAKNMSDKEIQAVADYIAGLK